MRPELETLSNLICEAGGRYTPPPHPQTEAALTRLGLDKARQVVLAAGRDRWYREKPERLVLETVFGPVQLPILLGRLRPTAAPRPTQPVAERQCPSCGATQRVTMNPFLVDDTVPPGTAVWIMPDHGCPGAGTIATLDEATAHEARRRAGRATTNQHEPKENVK